MSWRSYHVLTLIMISQLSVLCLSAIGTSEPSVSHRITISLTSVSHVTEFIHLRAVPTADRNKAADLRSSGADAWESEVS